MTTNQTPDEHGRTPHAPVEPAPVRAPGQGLDATIDVEGDDEEASTLLKEGADAPDAADIEDPATQR